MTEAAKTQMYQIYIKKRLLRKSGRLLPRLNGIPATVTGVPCIFPRTGLSGAILMTGILGGAMASHLRAGSPLFSHTLFNVYLDGLMWAGLWLRDPGIRALLP